LQQQGRRFPEHLFPHTFRDARRTNEHGPKVRPQGRTKIATTFVSFVSNYLTDGGQLKIVHDPTTRRDEKLETSVISPFGASNANAISV